MKTLILTTTVSLLVSSTCFAQSDSDQEMRSLTSSILAGINGPSAVATVDTPAADTDKLQILVEQALSEGQSDAYLEALIGEAAGKGEIEVPDAMRTTDGEVDTRTLLASIVAKSEAENATTTVAALQTEATGETEATVERVDQFHDVVSGDSLAAIAARYYGSAQDYPRIFNANRDTLSSPNQIQIGQRLLIPS